MHCNADVIFYFGSDLSSSGSIPVAIVTRLKTATEEVFNTCMNSIFLDKIENHNVVIFYEVGYYDSICNHCKQSTFIDKIILATLPACADLENWSINKSEPDDSNSYLIGGLRVDKNHVDCNNNSIMYFGDKKEQLLLILLRLGDRTVLHCNPLTGIVTPITGSQSREFKERFNASQRVRNARTIGLVIGSMGLTAETTKDIIHRLETLIAAAHKRSYCFVMGRLNEAKLCNFPEVDVFCLISNEDCAIIKPKTFPVPVITPFELELGLGARSWDSSFNTDISFLIQGGEVSLQEAVERVAQSYPIAEDSDEEQSNNGYDVKAKRVEMSNALVNASSTALTLHEPSVGPAVEYFQARKYQGLVPDLSVSNAEDLSIKPGLYGTAASYRHMG
mmetsp:Transcript_9907/g.14826  ORF Transcript_9907/g.14826 Transcript_9907/m.14826 type:complete len:391 (+) Transcript_9907:150-1322(+)